MTCILQQDDGLATELKTVLKDMKSLLSSAQERKVYEKRKSCRARCVPALSLVNFISTILTVLLLFKFNIQ